MSFKKIFHIFITLSISLSCSKEKDSRIVYELNANLTKNILNVYKKKDKKKLYYIQFHTQNAINRSITLDFCEDCKIKESIKKSNRFLKLNNTIFIPIAFFADNFLEIKTKHKFSKKLGGGTHFYINEKNELLNVGGDMK